MPRSEKSCGSDSSINYFHCLLCYLRGMRNDHGTALYQAAYLQTPGLRFTSPAARNPQLWPVAGSKPWTPPHIRIPKTSTGDEILKKHTEKITLSFSAVRRKEPISRPVEEVHISCGLKRVKLYFSYRWMPTRNHLSHLPIQLGGLWQLHNLIFLPPKVLNALTGLLRVPTRSRGSSATLGINSCCC